MATPPPGGPPNGRRGPQENFQPKMSMQKGFMQGITLGRTIWRAGKNIARVSRFSASPNAGKPGTKAETGTIYLVVLNNIHGKELPLTYLVPDGKEPGHLLKDLLHFFKQKSWLTVVLKMGEVYGQKVPTIISLEEIKDQEGTQIESFEERGGDLQLLAKMGGRPS